MIKKLIGLLLEKMSNSMVTLAPASYARFGVEDMLNQWKNWDNLIFLEKRGCE